MIGILPEHRLQIAAKSWVGHVCDPRVKFVAFDRSAKQSPLQHIREKERGIVTGWGDAALILPGGRTLWHEWKWFGKAPDADGEQLRVGAYLNSIGHEWFWVDSIEWFCRELRARGVDLSPRAELLALDFDLRVKGKDMKRRAVTPKTSKTFAEKPSMAKMKAQEKLRSRIMF